MKGSLILKLRQTLSLLMKLNSHREKTKLEKLPEKNVKLKQKLLLKLKNVKERLNAIMRSN